LFLVLVEERPMYRERSVRARRGRLRALTVAEPWCVMKALKVSRREVVEEERYRWIPEAVTEYVQMRGNEEAQHKQEKIQCLV
jgi:hypothetical protein